MCNKLKIRVKSLSPSGIKSAYLPCGKCFECRTLERDCWTSRLRGEILAVTPGTYTAFCTLTYSDEKLPHIPMRLVRDEYRQYYRTHGTPACFSKDDVSGFIKSLRDWFRLLGYKRPIYMCCCEFGEHTQRPHMHMILNFPMNINPRDVFDKVHQLWEPNGHVFPRYFEGGEDGHHYKHKPFLCESVNAACVYAAKYCTKDLKYYEQINLKHFKRLDRSEFLTVGGSEDVLKFSHYLPFHLQTRQLGLRCIEKLDTLAKLDILENGLQFVGDTHLHRLPKYYRNKLLFYNYYRKLKDGRRQVLRCPTVFFLEHHERIYSAREIQVRNQIDKWFSEDYWRNEMRCPPEKYLFLLGFVDYIQISRREFSDRYLCWFGVPYKNCRKPCDWMTDDVTGGWSSIWLNRFMDFSKGYKLKGVIASPDEVFSLQYIATLFHDLENECLQNMPDRLAREREAKRIGEIYKEYEY